MSKKTWIYLAVAAGIAFVVYKIQKQQAAANTAPVTLDQLEPSWVTKIFQPWTW
jgi:hypothetical protein